MNSSIRKVGLVLGVAFVLLLGHLNYVQLARSKDLTEDRRNRRIAYEEEAIKRGEILAADGSPVATSARSGDDRFIWTRRYPQSGLFGHITGYYTSPFFCDSAGVEKTQNAFLTGEEPVTPQDFVDELLGRRRDGNRIKLTVWPQLQKIARAAFGSQRGGAAVIDATNGAVLGLYGTPTYDPNAITKPLLDDCIAPKKRLERDPNKVLLSRAYQVRYPPGSTFKILTAAAAIELGKMNLGTGLGFARRIDLPDTDKTLGNFGGSSCGGSLLRSFEASCNTAFATAGMRAGEKNMIEMTTRFGLNADLPFDLEEAPSCIQAGFGFACEEADLSRPFVAYSAIGQGNVRVTPLQMALVAGTVANGGNLMRPHVVTKILDAKGALIRTVKAERIRRVYSPNTAKLMRTAMQSVVCNGTGRVVNFKRECRGVGGKTGTAQIGIPGKAPHVWFVAWEGRIAVAVVVENGGTLASEATGGRVAGPIAKALLEYAVDHHLHG